MDDIARERSYPTPVAHSPWLPLLLMSLASQKHSPRTKSFVRPKYDYIVVGAGSAGATVAGRLSEVPCVTVLLLEAGGTPPRLTEVPAYSSAFYGTDVDWKYKTVEQKYTGGGFPGRTLPYPRGKMLGGSSNLNANQYIRGSRKNYDNWAAAGAKGWSYAEVLPYFKKLEEFREPWKYAGNNYHGFLGPITDSVANYEPEMKGPLFQAHAVLGLHEIDVNGPTQTGSYDPQLTTRDGQRCGTAKAYLVPKENFTNLDIVSEALVTKVVINSQRVATGVLVDIRGRSRYIEARKEVILSAGAINTPQLLMLSGIGPADHLNNLGIPVLADLPVGSNLQDHPLITLPYELSCNVKSFQEKMEDVKTLFDYINYRSGPLTSSLGVVMQSFVNDVYANKAIDFPPVQVAFEEASSQDMKKRFIPEIYNQVYAPYENKTIVVCGPAVVQPKSRGSVELRSANPRHKPVVGLQLLEHAMDFEHLIEGMKFTQRIMTSGPMKRLGSKPFSTLFPGCEGVADSEDLYFRCVARLITDTLHHPVGTAKMGDPNDPTTVLDYKLRVKTINGLRVIDASVFPTITNGNVNIPVIMIAEKGSDMVKETITCGQRRPRAERPGTETSAYA